ncbi:MAG: ArsA-related P-loop ATPase [Thermodesulfobacteriota bacterium]
MNLLDRRIIFLMGKGGSGRTTLSAALAIAAARQNRTALILEAGDEDAVGPLFDTDSLEREPREIAPGIWGGRIDTRSVLTDYVHQFVGFPFVADTITRAELFEHIADGTPGLRELMVLGQIWRWEQEKMGSGYPKFDPIIVDGPATGHGMSLLRQPRAVLDMFRVGPLADQLRMVQEMLSDPGRSGVLLVTLPEELPINEAIDFIHAAEGDIQMAVTVTAVNGVYPTTFTAQDETRIRELLKKGDAVPDSLRPVLETARDQIFRRHLQEGYANRIRGENAGTVIEIPYVYSNRLFRDDIEGIADRLVQELELDTEAGK